MVEVRKHRSPTQAKNDKIAVRSIDGVATMIFDHIIKGNKPDL